MKAGFREDTFFRNVVVISADLIANSTFKIFRGPVGSSEPTPKQDLSGVGSKFESV